MPCKPFRSADGRIVGIMCTRTVRCHVCGKPHTALCDATKANGKPCDLPMCDDHKHTVGVDTDVCRYHNYPKYIKQAIENRKAFMKK